jgi:hypothetical protein
MPSQETAVVPAGRERRPRFSPFNTMNFPQSLRDAIPTMPGCWGRALKLSSVDGDSCHSALWGRQVRLKFHVEETGKLTGQFEVHALLNLEAARELAKTLSDLVAQAERTPPTHP